MVVAEGISSPPEDRTATTGKRTTDPKIYMVIPEIS
jgi:hypothetical protein